MAAEPRNVSGGAGWSKGDIVELVALLIGIPAAIGGVFMLATYYKRRSQERKGETLFSWDSRPQRPLGASSASHTGYLLSPLCDSCRALKARTNDETAMLKTSVGSKQLYSSACDCTYKWRTASANPWMGMRPGGGGDVGRLG
jgi:hypothetical protein